ncbi:MAG: hypothetical protein VB030_07310 [Eubacterium aggregans]|jgi:hypothetical protein|uniref:hypothetical protein n=1 Tax=Eubacterium aggregans TaxID=81409 RepID=UPI0023F2F9F4|nr:hypothetical protein [Eubacterium aggregans]MDD4691650.1 hypothetical protein [Eubacterium aggregans]MEA5073964.1 hypothetical protein [Eubacterium aggregans]
MTSYTYDKKRYITGIILPNVVLMGCLAVFALYDNIVIYKGFDLLSLVLVVAVYTLFNTLVALAYPQKIIDTGSAWEFHAFGRRHSYPKGELTGFHIRDLANSRIYLRVNGAKLFQGRYWIKLKMYSDGEALYQAFHDIEREMHPEDLKFNRRSSHTQTMG